VNAKFGGLGEVPMTFIRASYILQVGAAVEVLASVEGHMVAARQKNQLVTAFHPELTDDSKVHRYFLNIVKHTRVGVINNDKRRCMEFVDRI